MNTNLKCSAPFTYSEITNDGQYLCCPGWLPVDIKDTDNFKDNFYNKKSQEIRESILDGSYKFCKENLCPHLAKHKKGIDTPSFVHESNTIFKDPKLSYVTFGFDISCNLGCPSCRSEFINFVGERRIKMDDMLNNLINQVGDTIEGIGMCGGAEPFFSKTMMRFMREFDASKFPKLKKIHLHTNGTLWNKNSWNAISKIHKYISTCEISMDAGTKEIYNIVRLGGDWDILMNNIDFILTIDRIKSMRFSFVVQQRNYKDMENFYNLIHSKLKDTKKQYEIFYNPIVEWGEFESQNNFDEQEIHNPNHTEHNEFLIELKKIHRKPNVTHGLNHLITDEVTLI